MEAGPMMWWQQVLLGTAVVGAVIGGCYLLVWLLCRVPAGVEQTVLGVLEPRAELGQLGWDSPEDRAEWLTENFNLDMTPKRPQPSFVVAARLVGGMGDGEEVEVHSQLWLAHPPTELHIRAVDNDANPPVTHRLLYRVSPEDSQVFVFAGVEPAPHELTGD